MTTAPPAQRFQGLGFRRVARAAARLLALDLFEPSLLPCQRSTLGRARGLLLLPLRLELGLVLPRRHGVAVK